MASSLTSDGAPWSGITSSISDHPYLKTITLNAFVSQNIFPYESLLPPTHPQAANI